jgi:sortase B
MLRLNQTWIDPKTTSSKLVKEALLNAYYQHQSCNILLSDESDLSVEELHYIYASITNWAKRHGMNVYLVVETGFLYRLFNTFDESVLSFLEVTKLKKVWTLQEEDIRHKENKKISKTLWPSISLDKRKSVSFMIQTVSLVLISAGLIMSTLNYLEKQAHESLVKELQNLQEDITNPNIINPNPEPSKTLFEKMRNINNQYMGWIRIGNTNMSFPIVKGKDNQIYLNTNFDLKKSSYGSIFMDYRGIDFNDHHVIIYGHSVKHTAMFGNLIKYEQKDFFNEHQLITITDETYEYTYKVFSFQRIDADKTRLSLPISESSLNAIMQNYANQSAHQPSVYEPTQLLTLVSCEYSYDNGRVFVHAYLVNKQEISKQE